MTFEEIKLKISQQEIDTVLVCMVDMQGRLMGKRFHAEAFLEIELEEFESYVEDLVDVELEQCQFDALVCWTYNLGPTNLASSTMLKVLNKGMYEEVPYQMKRWNKAGGEVLNGLVRRREAEALLFQGEQWHEV